MKIHLAPYNPNWPIIFEQEKELLLEALTDIHPVIEHIGSTAIPGLSAKPIIDIQLGLPDFNLADEQVPKITALGYEYIDCWESELPNRRLFTKTKNETRTHNIHMVEIGTDWWNRHLAFRDYLRGNDEIRDAYFSLKKKLAKREWKDVNDYADAKTAFIRKIEKKAFSDTNSPD